MALRTYQSSLQPLHLVSERTSKCQLIPWEATLE